MKVKYEDHYSSYLFICVRQKPDDKKCCAQKMDMDTVNEIKKRSKERWMGKVRVSPSSCLGRCSEGGTAVIYPQGKWLTFLEKQDIEKIWQELVKTVEGV